MDKRLNYRKLLKQWMEFYSLSAEASKKMFATIWMCLQASIGKSDKEGVKDNDVE